MKKKPAKKKKPLEPLIPLDELKSLVAGLVAIGKDKITKPKVKAKAKRPKPKRQS